MTLQNSLEDKISELALRCIEDDSIFLVDVEIKGSHNKPIIWVLLESDKGGIKLDECAKISRQLQLLIEANEIAGSNFTLNVSSPGLSKPLMVKRQYKVNHGRHAKVKYNDGEKVVTEQGVIEDSNEDSFSLKTEKKSITITYNQVLETLIQPVI